MSETEMNNFNLSEKIKYTKKDGLFDKLKVHALDKHRVFREEDVKEFIRLLKGECFGLRDYDIMEIKIDKLAGEKLR